MRIAFYAPMKPPGATQPSGDRRMARGLIAALRRGGHEVDLASRFRSRDGAGDPRRQRRLRGTGERLAENLIARYRSGAASAPDLWFTYHLYYKAPDWIGPAVSRALGIPYVVAEASHAPKRAGGNWAIGHDGAEAAIRAADRIVCINPADAPCLLPLISGPRDSHMSDDVDFSLSAPGRAPIEVLLRRDPRGEGRGEVGDSRAFDRLPQSGEGKVAASSQSAKMSEYHGGGDGARLQFLPPFLDTAPFVRAAADREAARRDPAGVKGIAADGPLLIAVAMMRRGDKLASYALLAAALCRIGDRPWRLAIVGDGPARAEVEAAMARLGPDRVRFLGARATGELPRILASADLFVWPAVNEAYGMALLEAQAAGLPVVAGETGGVPDIVRHGETGLLTPAGDEAAFAAAVAQMLSDPARRRRMGDAAARIAATDHSLDAAARRLGRIVASIGKRRAA